MRILNVGFDKTLAGGKGFGDAVARHREYGRHLESLDIIVYTTREENLPVFQISENVTGYPTHSRNKLTFLFDAYRIAKKIHSHHKFQIVVAQDPFGPALIGGWLKKRYGCKLQINFHGDFWENPHWLAERWYHRIYLWISRYTVPHSDAIRVMSEGQKQKLLQAGVVPQIIRVISTPVDIPRFENFESQANPAQKKLLENLRKRTETGGKKTVLWVGKDDRAKDLDTLYKAIRYIKNRKGKDNVGFWMVGKKNFPNDLVDMITGPDSAGSVDSSDLPAYYHAAYLLVSSSSSESFGKVLVEANACGKPVVSTATTGAKEIISDGYNGFLVPIGDYNALAEKILYLLDHPDLAKQMGQNGQKMVKEKFGNNTQKILDFWREILGEKAPL